MSKKEDFKNRSRLASMLGTSADVINDEVLEDKRTDSTEEDKHTEGVPKEGLPNVGVPTLGTPKKDLLEIGMPDKQFCKVHNWIFDELPKILNDKEWIVYIHLYRLSLGFQKESCTIGYKGLQDRTGLGYNTVKRAIKGLLKKKYLIDKGSTQAGTEYKIGVPKEGLPSVGVPTLGRPITGTPNVGSQGVPKEGLPNVGTPGKNPAKSGSTEGIPNLGIPTMGYNKDSIKDSNKDNNNRIEKTVLLLTSSEIINLPEPIIYTLIDKTSCNQIENWLTFIEDKKEEINNPSGFFRCAIEQEWEIPSKWENSFKRKKEMEKKAKEEEERIAQEKTRWEEWLETIPDDVYEEAEEYAKKKVEESPISPKSEEIKSNMLEGFKKEFLRLKYENVKMS